MRLVAVVLLLLESEATRPFAEEAAQTIAGLRSRGFNQALGMAEADAARRQQTAINQAGLELSARQQQAGLLGGELGEQYRTLGLLSGLGGQQQQLEQARLQAQRAEFDRELDQPLRQLGLFTSSFRTNISCGYWTKNAKRNWLGRYFSYWCRLGCGSFFRRDGRWPPQKKTGRE